MLPVYFLSNYYQTFSASSVSLNNIYSRVISEKIALIVSKVCSLPLVFYIGIGLTLTAGWFYHRKISVQTTTNFIEPKVPSNTTPHPIDHASIFIKRKILEPFKTISLDIKEIKLLIMITEHNEKYEHEHIIKNLQEDFEIVIKEIFGQVDQFGINTHIMCGVFIQPREGNVMFASVKMEMKEGKICNDSSAFSFGPDPGPEKRFTGCFEMMGKDPKKQLTDDNQFT